MDAEGAEGAHDAKYAQMTVHGNDFMMMVTVMMIARFFLVMPVLRMVMGAMMDDTLPTAPSLAKERP